MLHKPFTCVLCVILSSYGADAQCSNDCPPLNMIGQAVPSICVGDNITGVLDGIDLPICHPEGTTSVRLSDYASTTAPHGPARIVVIQNVYVGCNAGRREANVYAYTSTMLHDLYPNVNFLSSLKGQGNNAEICKAWAEEYEQQGALSMDSLPKEKQPLVVHDYENVLRDALFTAPFPHPSYIIIDYNGRVRDKFTGPCCGFANYSACSVETAATLNATLYSRIEPLLRESEKLYAGGNADCFLDDWGEWSTCQCANDSTTGTQTQTRRTLQKSMGTGTCGPTSNVTICECAPVACQLSSPSDWSECSVMCGTGQRYRTSTVVTPASNGGAECPPLVEFESCTVATACTEQCVPTLGDTMEAHVVGSAAHGLSSPRDVAFTPVPGLQLGNFSSGQSFSTSGEEAWVANGNDHSVTIVTGIGEGMTPGFITRYDRGFFHYMVNITALSFNHQASGIRTEDQDTFGFFATCQDNNNTYIDLKEPNYFQGPTLYNPSPTYPNLVAHDGSQCTAADECFFLHSDMLHESPACSGIVHDPELQSAYGAVYWAIDGTVQQLVRYDFQQPHGPGDMDHSIASVRRYTDVRIAKGPPGIHQGMAIDAMTRTLYVAGTGDGTILSVQIDTGNYARTARTEFPIFSSRLPSFEYSIYQCAVHEVFATGLQTPSGLTLSTVGGSTLLFVAEYATGHIIVFDAATQFRIRAYETTGGGLMGLSFAPVSGRLYGVNALSNSLLEFVPTTACATAFSPYTRVGWTAPAKRDDAAPVCTPDSTIPNEVLFEQVHVGTGYASDDAAVQNDTIVDDGAALLSSRTDCEWDSDLNFDALLLGGWMCHRCLPDGCRDGGKCSAIQWSGYDCDNEIYVTRRGMTSVFDVTPRSLTLETGRTYRIIVNSPDAPVHITSGGVQQGQSTEMGILKVTVESLLDLTIVGPFGPILEHSTTTQHSVDEATTTTGPLIEHSTTTQRSVDEATTSTMSSAGLPGGGVFSALVLVWGLDVAWLA